MAFPAYTHQLTVTDVDVTPKGPFDCGVSGDKRATRLSFYFEHLPIDSIYRLEIVCGDGSYDLTDRLTMEDPPEIVFDIPTAWTAAGVAAVRLVEYVEENGEETARRYYPPFFLQFAYRDEGTGSAEAKPILQELITRAEREFENAAEAAKSAEESAIRAEKAAETAGSGGAGDVDASEVTYDGAHDKDIENVEQALSYLFGEVDGSNAVVAEIKTTLGVE